MKNNPRMTAIRNTLESVRKRCDVAARLQADPVGAVHRYADPLDQEIVGLVASSIAFGNVTTIRSKLDDALLRIGKSPQKAGENESALIKRMEGWKHRVFIGEDIAKLIVGARNVQREHESLGKRFARDWEETHDLQEALGRFTTAIRNAGNLHALKKRRGPAHILGNPRGPSANKRLLLYLRWMIRPADGIDLGLWPVSPSILLCPVDTHIHKLSRNLGFTKRDEVSWKTTVEIGRSLAAFDPADPAKYDFALCHMGMLQRCPSKRDPVRCEGCGVKPVCIRWNDST